MPTFFLPSHRSPVHQFSQSTFRFFVALLFRSTRRLSSKSRASHSRCSTAPSQVQQQVSIICRSDRPKGGKGPLMSRLSNVVRKTKIGSFCLAVAFLRSRAAHDNESRQSRYRRRRKHFNSNFKPVWGRTSENHTNPSPSAARAALCCAHSFRPDHRRLAAGSRQVRFPRRNRRRQRRRKQQ